MLECVANFLTANVFVIDFLHTKSSTQDRPL